MAAASELPVRCKARIGTPPDVGTSRHFVATQQYSRSWSEADIQRAALTEPNLSVRARVPFEAGKRQRHQIDIGWFAADGPRQNIPAGCRHRQPQMTVAEIEP